MTILKNMSLVTLATLVLVGCSTSKEQLLPPGDQTMLALWQNNTVSHDTNIEARSTLRRSLTDKEQGEIASYSRNAENEIQQLFPRLPNPDLEIYIYPHLAGNNTTPVPGYSTVFPLYTQIQYALPGERIGGL